MQLGPRQLRLVEALESGTYVQGGARLKRKKGDIDTYCCLGVASELAKEDLGLEFTICDDPKLQDVYEIDGAMSFLPDSVINYYRFKTNNGKFKDQPSYYETGESCSLAGLNDYERLSFKEIAQFIRDHVEHLFTESI